MSRIELSTDLSESATQQPPAGPGSPELVPSVAFLRQRGRPSNPRQLAHDAVKRGLALEADAGAVGQRDGAALDAGIVGKAAEIAEHAGIGFRTAEAEAGGDGERHLVAAMREQRAALPALARQHVDRVGILADAIGLRRIDLDDIAVGAKAAA